MSGTPDNFRLPPYDMTHESRGMVLIFNNKKYDKHEERKFSDMDVGKINDSLKSLGYKKESIKQHRDFTTTQMLKAIRDVAAMDHTHSDCLVIVFLCYGEQNLVIAKDQQIGLQVLLKPLKGDMCHESLVGKPKLIILQNCNLTTRVQANDTAGKKDIHCVPPEADFAYLGTEVPGLVPNRNFVQGSLFIEHLTKQLTEAGKSPIELRQVMTRTLAAVTKEMDKGRPDWCDDYDDRMPYFINMLTRDLYFCHEKKPSGNA